MYRCIRPCNNLKLITKSHLISNSVFLPSYQTNKKTNTYFISEHQSIYLSLRFLGTSCNKVSSIGHMTVGLSSPKENLAKRRPITSKMCHACSNFGFLLHNAALIRKKENNVLSVFQGSYCYDLIRACITLPAVTPMVQISRHA